MSNQDRLLSDEELEKQLDDILNYDGDSIHHNTKLNILLLLNTQKRLYAESVMNTKHDWKDNDTWSVFKCINCGMTVFTPNKLPEYGCQNEI